MKYRIGICIITIIAIIICWITNAEGKQYYWIVDSTTPIIENEIKMVCDDPKTTLSDHKNINDDHFLMTPQQNEVIDNARQYLGVPYLWGGRTPNGFDCSGLVQYVYGKTGKILPRTTIQQEQCGKLIGIKDAKAGDLYFWGERNHSYHVAIACGNGNYIHAPAPGQNVKYGKIEFFKPDFAIRLN